MSRAVVDSACARFGIQDAIAGKSDRDVWALVAPFMGAHSLPQLRAQLQARLPPHVRVDAVLSPAEQQTLYHSLQAWQRQFGF